MNQKYAETIIKRPSLYEALEVHGVKDSYRDKDTDFTSGTTTAQRLSASVTLPAQ